MSEAGGNAAEAPQSNANTITEIGSAGADSGTVAADSSTVSSDSRTDSTESSTNNARGRPSGPQLTPSGRVLPYVDFSEYFRLSGEELPSGLGSDAKDAQQLQ
jgi:hypothetical protein